MTDFEKVQYVRQCCFSILPQLYCDRFSITEQIGKIVNALNKLIENNNKLEDYVKEIIREVIESGEIEEIIKDMLANYILNVKYPPEGIEPASGDGSKDDTLAIQGCIDYAYSHGGMCIYFPSGNYLTGSLLLKNKTSFIGFDRYTTRIVLKGGATIPLLTGNINEISLNGLCFDGNMDIQVNNIDLIDITVNSGLIENCLLTDGYNLLKINTTKEFQISSTIFEYAVETSLISNGIGSVIGNNLIFNNISSLKGKSFVELNNSKSILKSILCNNTAPVCCIVNGSNNYIELLNKTDSLSFTNNGVNNTLNSYGKTETQNLTGDKNIKVNNVNIITDENLNISAKKVETNTDEFKTSSNIINENTKTKNLTSETIQINSNDTTFNGINTNINSETLNTESTNNIETVTQTKKISAKEIILEPENPLTYGEPEQINDNDSLLPMKSLSGEPYYIHVVKSLTNTEVDNIEKLISSNATIGNYIKVLGYYNKYDGGDGVYLINNNTLYDNISIHLNNGLNATLVSSSPINIKAFGMKSNDLSSTTINNDGLNKAIQYCKIMKKSLFVPIGKFSVTGTFNIDFSLKIEGEHIGDYHYYDTSFEYASIIEYAGDNVDSNNYLFNITGSNTGCVDISNILFYGGLKNKSCFRFRNAGWTLYLNSITIDGFLGRAMIFDQTYDSVITAVTIERCGRMVESGNAIYAVEFINNSNALNFTDMHIEFCRYYFNFQSCFHINFNGGKAEIGNYNVLYPYQVGVDTDVTNANIVIYPKNAKAITFTAFNFISVGDMSWKNANPELPFSAFPAMIHVKNEIITEPYGSLLFSNCKFTCIKGFSGLKIIKMDSSSWLYKVLFSNCEMGYLSVLRTAIDGTNINMSNCFLTFGVSSEITSYTMQQMVFTGKAIGCTFLIEDSDVAKANENKTPYYVNSALIASNNIFRGFLPVVENPKVIALTKTITPLTLNGVTNNVITLPSAMPSVNYSVNIVAETTTPSKYSFGVSNLLTTGFTLNIFSASDASTTVKVLITVTQI